MKHELIMENWRKFVKEEQARMNIGASPGGASTRSFLDADFIFEQCKRVWTYDAMKNAMFKSVRGLPSIIDLTLAITKDKDISVMANLAKSDSKTVKIEFASNDGKTKYYGSADSDPKTGTRRVKFYPLMMPRMNKITRKVLNPIWIRQYYAKRTADACRRGGGDFDERRCSHKHYRFEQMPAVDSTNLDNVINLWGFVSILITSVILVHELAHAFDPNNPYNLASSLKDLDNLFDGGMNAKDDKEWPFNTRLANFIRKMRSAIDSQGAADEKSLKLKKQKAIEIFTRSESGRAEMFATNREKDYISDIMSSKLINSVFSAEYQGPSKGAAKLDVNSFSFASCVLWPEEKYIPKVLNLSGQKEREEFLKQSRDLYREEVARSAEIAKDLLKQELVESAKEYTRWCSKRLVAMSKDIQADIFGVAAGESPDRLQGDSYEDRIKIRNFDRES